VGNKEIVGATVMVLVSVEIIVKHHFPVPRAQEQVKSYAKMEVMPQVIQGYALAIAPKDSMAKAVKIA